MVRMRRVFLAGNQDFHDFLDEFQRESDRAAAVLSAAYLDELLKQLLLASFVDNSRTVTDLLGPNAALGSFGGRVNLAYALGLITKAEAGDLNLLRRIRNDFAHHLHGLSFNTRRIADRCANFQCNEERFAAIPGLRAEYPSEARKLFDLAAALLSFYLTRRVHHAARAQPAKPPLWLATPPEQAPSGTTQVSNREHS